MKMRNTLLIENGKQLHKLPFKLLILAISKPYMVTIIFVLHDFDFVLCLFYPIFMPKIYEIH